MTGSLLTLSLTTPLILPVCACAFIGIEAKNKTKDKHKAVKNESNFVLYINISDKF
ncbi:MAG: hypothetical protein OHK0057_29380 [Thermoflexibacter sp.]